MMVEQRALHQLPMAQTAHRQRRRSDCLELRRRPLLRRARRRNGRRSRLRRPLLKLQEVMQVKEMTEREEEGRRARVRIRWVLLKLRRGATTEPSRASQGRSFHHQAGAEDIKLCTVVSKGGECTRGDACKWSHDVSAYLAARLGDIQLALPTSSDDLTAVLTDHTCPAFSTLGECAFGFKCRFGLSHMRKVEDGAGVAGSGWELIVDHDKIAQRKLELGEERFSQLSDKGEYNFISMEKIKTIRQGESPLAVAYLNSIGETLDTRPEHGKNKGKRGRDGKPNNRNQEDAAAAKAKADAEAAAAAAPTEPTASTSTSLSTDTPVDTPSIAAEPTTSTAEPSTSSSTPAACATATPMDVDSQRSRSFIPDMAPIRATEKKRLDWRGKLYLAPLTTVGNEPFRRLCGDFGNDISCSEMGLAQEFMNGECCFGRDRARS